MSARQYPANESSTIKAELAALEEVRDLLRDVDLTTDEGAKYALELLRQRGLPDFLVYGAKHTTIRDVDIRWAEKRLAELRASGHVS